MKLPSLPRWAKLSTTIFVVLLFTVVSFRGCGSKKPVAKSDPPAAITDKKSDTKPEPVTTTTPTLQRIESAITAIQTGLADLTKGLANLNSRMEILEKRLTPQVTSEISKKKTVPPISKSPLSVLPTTVSPTTTTPPTAAVDLTPVERVIREGLSGIVDAIKETHAQLSVPAPFPVHTTEPSPTTPASDNPCANWVQDFVRHRRCRLYNQLP